MILNIIYEIIREFVMVHDLNELIRIGTYGYNINCTINTV